LVAHLITAYANAFISTHTERERARKIIQKEHTSIPIPEFFAPAESSGIGSSSVLTFHSQYRKEMYPCRTVMD
jgi:hypothetical protein